jgi:hypothetical protein
MVLNHNRLRLIGIAGLWLLAQACAKKEPLHPQTVAVIEAKPKIVVAERNFICLDPIVAKPSQSKSDPKLGANRSIYFG